MSFRDRLRAICEPLPGAEWESGDGIPSWKIGGKMFATTGHSTPGVSVKTSDVATARMLIEAGVAEKAKYFHASWVRLPEAVAEDELRHRVLTSYDIVRGSLSKAAQAHWPAREDA